MTARKRRADRWIDAVVDGGALPEGHIDDPDDVAALRAAIELRAARPAADLPSEEFVANLRRRLGEHSAQGQGQRTRQSGVSRRALLAGAGSAVAAGVAGVVADRTLGGVSGSHAPNQQTALTPDDGVWLAVATEAEIADGGAHRFATTRLVGFVSQQAGQLSAVSGACTHMGCLLQPDAGAARLDCPCHRTAFNHDGQVAFSQLATPPSPLPRIQVRRRDQNIEVLVPKEA